MKVYLINSSPKFAARSRLQRFLDEHPRVSYWYACLPNAVFAVTDLSAHDLAKALERQFGVGPGHRFLVSEVSGNRQGRLPKDLWDILRDPSRVTSKG
jgi:hypothetical protein